MVGVERRLSFNEEKKREGRVFFKRWWGVEIRLGLNEKKREEGGAESFLKSGGDGGRMWRRIRRWVIRLGFNEEKKREGGRGRLTLFFLFEAKMGKGWGKVFRLREEGNAEKKRD